MTRLSRLLAALGLLACAAPALADPVIDDSRLVSGGGSASLPPYLQCVPYARQVSGIAIYGDAHTWWNQAEGRYARGSRPKIGAVMTFRPHGNSTLGHVAAVSRIVDSRTVLVRHANWSPIDGRRGQIEDNVKVVDVSPAGDWSEVRVWYAPIGNLGGAHWPVQGFIYPGKPKQGDVRPASTGVAGPTVGADPIAAIIKRRMRW
ncbi:CHAP domain-containing protein [Novosphingobium aquiterrae]|uniref:CHAP domain-containing protein n=1 Tax=Novosphingobium aquiterrae TaxID=624388 RepID=A0ABV6PFF3_9SPHN